MNLKGLLTERKQAIVKRWFDAVSATYPGETAKHLQNTKAQFTNPVGYTLNEGMAALYDGLLKGVMPSETATFLDGIVRVRAVQDFTPSQAVSFVFLLKTAIREELAKELRERPFQDELGGIDSAIDDLALYAFDLYVACREKIYDIKAREAQNATFRLLQRAKLIVGDGE